MTARQKRKWFDQSGATTVEFALVAMCLITLVIGMLQFGWVMHTFNSAAEATRAGARLAVVNPVGSGAVLAEMQYFLPDLEAANVVISYQPLGQPCEYVVVSLAAKGDPGKTPYTVRPWFFWPPTEITVPPFTTALSRESLGSS